MSTNAILNQRELNKKKIISCKGDSNQQAWKDVSMEIEKSGIHKHFIGLLPPARSFIEHCFKQARQRENLVHVINGLECGFSCLHKYASNLCGGDDKSDFTLIKTYTGYYMVKVASVIADHESILMSMGYKHSKENPDEFKLHHVTSQIEDLTFELFLAYLYCKRIKKLMEKVLNYEYDYEIAFNIYELSEQDDFFKDDQVIHYCELQKKNRKSGLPIKPLVIHQKTEISASLNTPVLLNTSEPPNTLVPPNTSAPLKAPIPAVRPYKDIGLYSNPEQEINIARANERYLDERYPDTKSTHLMDDFSDHEMYDSPDVPEVEIQSGYLQHQNPATANAGTIPSIYDNEHNNRNPTAYSSNYPTPTPEHLPGDINIAPSYNAQMKQNQNQEKIIQSYQQ